MPYCPAPWFVSAVGQPMTMRCIYMSDVQLWGLMSEGNRRRSSGRHLHKGSRPWCPTTTGFADKGLLYVAGGTCAHQAGGRLRSASTGRPAVPEGLSSQPGSGYSGALAAAWRDTGIGRDTRPAIISSSKVHQSTCFGSKHVAHELHQVKGARRRS